MPADADTADAEGPPAVLASAGAMELGGASGQFLQLQFAQFRIEGLESQNRCLCSIQFAL